MSRQLFASALALSLIFPLAAQAAADTAAAAATTPSAATAVYTEGEIKKIDLDQGKVTLKHGPIENLGMPGMTMVFRVADPAKLASFKAGDAVKFKADRIEGAFQVTELVAR
jgi:Cu/Ag efflux protein CusF